MTKILIIKVICSNDRYKVGGTLSGLQSGQKVTLVNNGDTKGAITLTATGKFTMPQKVPFNGSYNVTVATQPKNQTCSVANYSGRAVQHDINDINIKCSNDKYKIGGTLSGLQSGQKVTLVNNGDIKGAITLERNGTFIFNQEVPFEGNYDVTILSHPQGELCVVHNGTGEVKGLIDDVKVSCSISPGMLVPLPGANASTGSHPQSIVVTPNGKYTYVVNAESNNISMYSIDSNGTLSAIEKPISAGVSPMGIAVTPDGKYAYVANLLSNNVSMYSIGSNGKLSILGTPIPESSGPIAIAVTPDGKYAYVVDNYKGSAISVYSIGSNGQLSALGKPLSVGDDPVAIVITPDGKYAYVIHAASNTISMYSISSNGQLSVLGSPVSTGPYPIAIAITPDGKYTYVANNQVSELGSPVSMYSIGSGGKLSALVPPLPDDSENPRGIAVTPDGKYAYVVTSVGVISIYSIGSNGQLSVLGNSVAKAAGAIVVTPDGKYAYVVNNFSRGVAMYSIVQ